MRVKLTHLSIVFFLFSGLWAQEKSVHQLALQGIDLATQLRYEEAVALFDEMIRREPDNPRGYFLRSAVYFWMFSEDIKNEEIGEKFRDHSFRAAEVAEARLEENKNDIDALFYLGGAYGSLGRYYAMTRSFLNAYWYGKKGKEYLEQVVEMDAQYYDAYLGLGIFNYLADVLPRFIKILSFILGIQGDKEVGINQLEMAAEKGIYTKTEAMFFLSAIYTYREREYEKAIKILNQLLKKYPGNPGALFTLGRSYSFMGECDKALAAFNMVLSNEKNQSLLPRGSIYYQLAEVYFNKNQFERAKKNYLLAIASDTAEVGKRRWITPRSHLKVSRIYAIEGDSLRARYHLNQIAEEDNERAYEAAQALKNNSLKDIDMRLIKTENAMECNQFDQAMIYLNQIFIQYENKKDDPYIRSKLVETTYRKARILYEMGQYRQAADIFEEITTSEQEIEEWLIYRSYFYLGNCYKELGEFAMAEDAYDEAEGTDSDWLLQDIEQEREEIPDNY